MRKKLTISLVLLALAAAVWLFLMPKKTAPPKKNPLNPTVDQQLKLPQEEPAKELKKSETNTLQAYRFVPEPPYREIVRFTVPGKLEFSPKLETGDRFSKNDLLFQLDNSALFDEISRKKTELKAKVEGLYEQISRETPEAYPKWHAYGEAITETDLLPPLPDNISARERAVINSSGIVPLSLQIGQKEQEIFAYFYLAPFDGKVERIVVRPGKELQAGQKVAEISSGELVLRGKIHRRDLASFAGKHRFMLNETQTLSLSFSAGKPKAGSDSVSLWAKIPVKYLDLFSSEAIFLRPKTN